MGLPMAQRLLAAGFTLTVWNRSREKSEKAAEKGATVARSPAEVARTCDIVMLCLKDTAVVDAVVFGPEGIGVQGRADKLLIDFSSIDPEQTRIFSKRLEEKCGMPWIDAPVSGGTPGAESGSLIIMAGGPAAEIARVSPILEHLAQRITHMGEVGCGQLTKVCNQILVGCTIAAVSEVIRLAEANGINVANLPDCLAGGFADSTVLQYHARRMIANELSGRGRATTMLKDMETACSVARKSGTTAPLTSLTTELYRLLVNQGHGDLDQIGLIELYKAPMKRDQ